jgi:hypothetical protein
MISHPMWIQGVFSRLSATMFCISLYQNRKHVTTAQSGCMRSVPSVCLLETYTQCTVCVVFFRPVTCYGASTTSNMYTFSTLTEKHSTLSSSTKFFLYLAPVKFQTLCCDNVVKLLGLKATHKLPHGIKTDVHRTLSNISLSWLCKSVLTV